jgi:hypothetical protein
MIKGVNKQIIEIPEPGSKYFDKAILFVSSDYQNRPTAEIRRYARQYLAGIGTPPKYARQKARRMQNRRIALAVVCAAVVTAATVWIALAL